MSSVTQPIDRQSTDVEADWRVTWTVRTEQHAHAGDGEVGMWIQKAAA